MLVNDVYKALLHGGVTYQTLSAAVDVLGKLAQILEHMSGISDEGKLDMIEEFLGLDKVCHDSFKRHGDYESKAMYINPTIH